MHNKPSRILKKICCLLLPAAFCCVLMLTPLTAQATTETLQEAAEERKNLPIQSDAIENWPAGPQIGAEAAILMEVNTGVILYAKNIDEALYPASTTKILTCLLAVENGNLDDMVSFSHDAVFSVPYDGSNMGMDVGESITLEECLYGIMVGSANEVANAVAEYVSGSMDDFAELMNERAAELGATNSHFVNANGLPDENHYTTVHDLALVAQVFFQNELLCKISNTRQYHFEPTATQPDDFYLNNKHKLITGEIAYDGIVGGKTGYTDAARQTLVTCAEQNGMKLVCIVFKEESPDQFTDTVELFDYGFQNFQMMNIADHESRFNLENANFFQSDIDIFGSSKQLLSIDEDSYVIVPNRTDFSELTSEISYGGAGEDQIAEIDYSYNGNYVGCTYVTLADSGETVYEFNVDPVTPVVEETVTAETEENTIFINIKYVLAGIVILAALLVLIFIIRALIMNRRRARRRQNHLRRKKRRRGHYHSEFEDFDF